MINSAKELLEKLPPLQKFNMISRLASVKFTKNIDFTFKFTDLQSLLADVPAFDEDDNPNGLPQVCLSLSVICIPSILHAVGSHINVVWNEYQQASVQKLKAGLAQVAEMPVSVVVQSAVESGPLAGMVLLLPLSI
jgi:hypothetical protein